MPEKWDAQKDQKLLLIILEQNHINYRKVAETWSEKYGTPIPDPPFKSQSIFPLTPCIQRDRSLQPRHHPTPPETRQRRRERGRSYPRRRQVRDRYAKQTSSARGGQDSE